MKFRIIKNTFLILLLSIASNLMAQKDTLYFNAVWNKTTKQNAEFYRPMPLKKVGDMYQIKDYYINGNLQMEGLITHPAKEIYHGKAIWYYKNGNKEQEFTYKNGERNGLSKTYFKDGSSKTKGTYKNDKAFDGTFESCCPYTYIDEFKNGNRIAGYRYYKDTKVIAEKSIKDKEGHTNKIIVYTKKGEQIADVSVKPIEKYSEGKHVRFHIDNDKNILSIEGYENYKNSRLEGECVELDLKGNQIAKGIYKGGKPFLGTFLDYNILETYIDGKLEGEEIAYEKGRIIAKGINKNNAHWNGQFKITDNTIASYKNGQLEGKTTTYYTDSFGYYLGKIKSYHHIKNNKKEGESAYFNEKGEQIAKGIYKNDISWMGSFYDDYNKTLSSYKEGKKHGLFIKYGYKWKIIDQQEYKNDERSGKVFSKGYFQNRSCECDYKNGEPFNGQVCEDLSVLIYRNGKIVKRETYKRDAQDTVEEIQFYNDKGEVAKKTSYHKDKQYTLTFKNGKPDDGQIYSEYSNGLLTYKEGRLNGPFTEQTYQGVFITGNYKDDVWDGTVTFEDKRLNKTTTCTYKEGAPFKGTVIENNCITSYNNGLKTGLEQCKNNLYFKINNNYTLIYDSIVQHYKKGKLDGKVQYFKEGKLVSTAQYFDGHINQGTVYIKKTFENYYKNNKLVKSTYYFGNYKLVEDYNNYLITKETTTKDNKIVYQGHFKNGEANNGTFITIDAKEEPRNFTRTLYKNGKKYGEEQTINLIENTVEETTFYKEGIILRKIKKFPFKGLDSIIGIYKKGKPFSGHFYSKNSTIEKIEYYKKGKKTGMQYYYSTTGSLLKPILDSIKYVNDKPFDGVDLEIVNKDYHKHFYKKGKQIQIEIFALYYQGITALPLFKVTSTDTGFITFKSTGDTFEKYNELTYTNIEKVEGKVEFFTENEKGYLKFKNDELRDVQIKLKIPNVSITMYLEKPNLLLADAKFEDLQVKMYPEFKLSSIPDYKDFLDINNLFFRGSGAAHFYLDAQLLSKCTIKKGRGYQGIVIKQQKNDLFIYRKYQNGKPIKTRKRLTKEQLITLVKQKE